LAKDPIDGIEVNQLGDYLTEWWGVMRGRVRPFIGYTAFEGNTVSCAERRKEHRMKEESLSI
jgi:hypothetical protein